METSQAIIYSEKGDCIIHFVQICRWYILLCKQDDEWFIMHNLFFYDSNKYILSVNLWQSRVHCAFLSMPLLEHLNQFISHSVWQGPNFNWYYKVKHGFPQAFQEETLSVSNVLKVEAKKKKKGEKKALSKHLRTR